QAHRVLPVSAKTATAAVYQTFFAARPSAGAPFGAPVLVKELAFPDRSTVDGFLSEDGLTLFFSSAPLQFPGDAAAPPDGGVPTSDLYVAWRRAADESF